MSDTPLVAAVGARGHGKSAWVKQYLQRTRPRRLAVWDLKREYHADMVTADLGQAIRAMSSRTWSVAFHPDAGDDKRRAAQFDLWCRALMAAGRCTAVVEELAFVTRPSSAPPGWRALCLLGRHEGVAAIGTSQRPASIDKDFLGNCTLIHAARLPFEDDARTVARSLGVPFADLMALPALHWVERGEGDDQARRGVLTFRGSSSSSSRTRRGA